MTPTRRPPYHWPARKTPDTRGPEEAQGQLQALAAALRGVARCQEAVPAGEGVEAVILRVLLDRARQDLAATAWKLERQAAGRPGLPERGETDRQEEGWPPVRFAPDFDTAAAMPEELRAYRSVLTVLREVAGALRDLKARLGRRSLLVEDEPEPELAAAVAEAAAVVETAVQACR